MPSVGRISTIHAFCWREKDIHEQYTYNRTKILETNSTQKTNQLLIVPAKIKSIFRLWQKKLIVDEENPHVELIVDEENPHVELIVWMKKTHM